MARVNIGGGRWYDDNKATTYEEKRWWDGNNHVSCATGSQWDHERLIRTAKGMWILYSWSQWQGSRDSYEVLEEHAAHTWLAENGHDDAVPKSVLAALEV